MTYLVYDIESSYGKHAGRVSSRWNPEFGLCSIGWITGGVYSDRYTVAYDNNAGERRGARPGDLPFPVLDGMALLVGHNIKFDLLWYWDHPELIAFLKRGGRIWDTMYAEYLLSGQLYTMHSHGAFGIGLKRCAERRGLKHQKLDMVAALWDSGVRTEDIEEAILLEYQKGDILTTEELFLAQVKQAREQGQVTQIQQRMEGLLATTAMEFNGMYIDQEVAAELQKELEIEIEELQEKLDKYIPELPDECVFNWASWRNISALLFGGDITYMGTVLSLKDGEPQYYLKKIRVPSLDKNGNEQFFKSGKNKGEKKMKWQSVPDYERGPKTKKEKLSFHIDGMTKPEYAWKSSAEGYYSTGKEVMEKLKARGIPLVDDLLRLSGAMKDLGTYYSRFNKGKWTGMLTNIQPDGMVHGELNHAVTVTSRLSSSSPNLQNMPSKGKSKVKKCFKSRFPAGVVAELDYSQLEVVCKGVLSGDEALLQALIDGLCQHCEWASFVYNVPYDEVYQKAKVDKEPTWVERRQGIKSLTFGEAYGKGVQNLARDAGLEADLVEQAVAQRRRKYHKMYEFDEKVMQDVQLSRQNTSLRTDSGWQRGVGYFRGPTGCIFAFTEDEAPEWLQKKGTHTSFSPTCVKNYPSQGLGGEIMQVMAGLIFRAIFRNNLENDVLLINTVHDSVYLDFRTEELAKKYIPLIAGILEKVCEYFNNLYPECAWNTPFPIDADYGESIYDTNNTITERDPAWFNQLNSPG